MYSITREDPDRFRGAERLFRATALARLRFWRTFASLDVDAHDPLRVSFAILQKHGCVGCGQDCALALARGCDNGSCARGRGRVSARRPCPCRCMRVLCVHTVTGHTASITSRYDSSATVPTTTAHMETRRVRRAGSMIDQPDIQTLACPWNASGIITETRQQELGRAG